MAYTLHISRNHIEDENEDNFIAFDDWEQYVNEHPEFELVGEASGTFPDGMTFNYKSEGLAIWRGHSDNHIIYFDYRSGEIHVDSADDETIEEMIRVAKALHAIVRGDEGEIYHSTPLSAKKSFWQRWFKN